MAIPHPDHTKGNQSTGRLVWPVRLPDTPRSALAALPCPACERGVLVRGIEPATDTVRWDCLECGYYED